MKKLHSEKIINTKSLFELQDRERNKISYVLDYNDKENPEKEYKMVLIANENIYNNLKNNQITQFFMDCTYKMVLLNKKNFKLMVLCGYDIQKKKHVCVFFL